MLHENQRDRESEHFFNTVFILVLALCLYDSTFALLLADLCLAPLTIIMCEQLTEECPALQLEERWEGEEADNVSRWFSPALVWVSGILINAALDLSWWGLWGSLPSFSTIITTLFALAVLIAGYRLAEKIATAERNP